MDFLMLPSVPFARIHLSDAAKNPVLILSAELYGNAILKESGRWPSTPGTVVPNTTATGSAEE